MFSFSKSTLLSQKYKLYSGVPFEVSERLILSLFLSAISKRAGVLSEEMKNGNMYKGEKK